MERRHRLSRSRDFDAVYRQGRSVSTRSLTLHWFAREDEPDGQLPGRARGSPRGRHRSRAEPPQAPAARDVWTELAAEAPAGRDYVLVARPGLAEPAATRGHEWLVEQVREVLGKVSRMRCLGIGARPRVAVDARPADAGRDVQVPPELLAVRARRVPRARARPRRDPRRLAAPSLQPVEPRRGRPPRRPDAVQGPAA